jgi:hypothetical protein
MGSLGPPPRDWDGPDRRTGDQRRAGPPREDRVSFGMLAVAKRDLERLRHLLLIVPKLTDTRLPPRVTRGLPHRPAFPDALLWAEIFADMPSDVLEHWRHAREHRPPPEGPDAGPAPAPGDAPPGQRRRRRRRRRRGRGGPPAQ